MFNNSDRFEFTLPSCINSIGTAVENIMQFCQKCCDKIDENALFDLKVVSNELISNAVKHGNCEDDSKLVKISVSIDTDKLARIIVEDEGEGYEYRYHKCRSAEHQPAEYLKESGRGMVIVDNLCENVNVNFKGNKVEVSIKLSNT